MIPQALKITGIADLNHDARTANGLISMLQMLRRSSGESSCELFMPTSLIHRIGIAAPAETIYRALTTEDGIRAWWTTDVKIGARVGDAAVFGFFDHSTGFEIRIEQLTPPSLAPWQCTGASATDPAGKTPE